VQLRNPLLVLVQVAPGEQYVSAGVHHPHMPVCPAARLRADYPSWPAEGPDCCQGDHEQDPTDGGRHDLTGGFGLTIARPPAPPRASADGDRPRSLHGVAGSGRADARGLHRWRGDLRSAARGLLSLRASWRGFLISGICRMN
jgi:hypothetical protein